MVGSHLTVVERVKRPGDAWKPRRELIALGVSCWAAAAVGGMPVMANLAVCQESRRSQLDSKGF